MEGEPARVRAPVGSGLGGKTLRFESAAFLGKERITICGPIKGN